MPLCNLARVRGSLCLAVVLLLSLPTFALPAEEPIINENPNPSASSSEPASRASEGRHWPFIFSLHGGLPLESEDADVRNHWSHDTWYSYLVDLGAYWASPKFIYRSVAVLAGMDFSYLHDEENLTSHLANSYIHSNTTGFFATAGIEWQPGFLGGRWGFTVFGSYPISNQKTTTFETRGYTQALGLRNVYTIPYGLNIEWALTPQWRPYLGLEERVGSIITLGLNYAL